MPDERIDIWNILHDGSITAVESKDDIIRMFVGIAHLRRRFQPPGDSFVVALSGVSHCEFRHFDGETTNLSDVFETGEPEILSTSSEGFPITIQTTLGRLIVSFDSISVALDTGQPILFGAIERVAAQYWEEFERRRTDA
jgi:hypothetical protein